MALTKISGGVIQQPINVGIITATSGDFSGIVTASSINATTATFSGNVSIAGTLTYEDVTNVDSIGLITARNGIKVLANGIDAVGVITATSFSGDGSALTGIDATALKDSDGNVKVQANTSGIVVTGVSTLGNTVVGGGTTQLIVTGDARVTGILTIGTSSITLDGSENQVNVGTGVTIHHTNGVQVGGNTVHSTGITVNNINASGIITATSVKASSISASGGTNAERPTDAATGTIRYNTESGSLEYFDGTHWLAIGSVGYRGLFGAGAVYPGTPPFSTTFTTNAIDYLTIAALGNAQDFGDLSVTSGRQTAVSSSTRGVFGASAFVNNILDYVTIATTGNALDFGDDIANPLGGAASNETRGLFAGGYISNVIRYITIASTGNAVDFGDIAETKFNLSKGSVASPTRGIFAGGSTFAPVKANRIEYVTIASTGNATNFGDMTTNTSNSGSCSSSTRGVFTITNGDIDYLTIASSGNTVDFGGGSVTRSNSTASNNIRAVFAGGYITNVMGYVTIATTGDAIDFGDLTTLNRWNTAGLSNGHGGVQ